MTTKEYAERVVEGGRSIWAACVALAAVGIMLWGEWWWFLPFIPLVWVSYYACLFGIFIYLNLSSIKIVLDPEEQLVALNELNERIAAGETEGPRIEQLKALVGIKNGHTTRVSEEKIGSYQGHDIYAWIEVTTDEGSHRFEFDSVAPKDADGTALVPRDGETYAHLFGINYKRVQPENAA